MDYNDLIKNITLVYSNDIQNSEASALLLFNALKQKNILSTIVSINNLIKEATFVIVMGGDGSILKTARFYAPLNVPILGVNLGRLGFLSQVNLENINFLIEQILNNKYEIEKRLMIECKEANLYALNDIVIKGDTISRTSRFYLKINGQKLCEYLADGLIVSTPTGSTAYTLSAGGPICHPCCDNLIIVPICPHTLTSRPIVVPATHEIEISTCKNCNNIITIADGQQVSNIPSSLKIVIKKSNFYAKLMVLKDLNNDFYSILRDKLSWGVSPKVNRV